MLISPVKHSRACWRTAASRWGETGEIGGLARQLVAYRNLIRPALLGPQWNPTSASRLFCARETDHDAAGTPACRRAFRPAFETGKCTPRSRRDRRDLGRAAQGARRDLCAGADRAVA